MWKLLEPLMLEQKIVDVLTGYTGYTSTQYTDIPCRTCNGKAVTLSTPDQEFPTVFKDVHGHLVWTLQVPNDAAAKQKSEPLWKGLRDMKWCFGHLWPYGQTGPKWSIQEDPE